MASGRGEREADDSGLEALSLRIMAGAEASATGAAAFEASGIPLCDDGF